MHKLSYKLIAGCIALLTTGTAMGQKDTNNVKSVNITSSFRPELRAAAKLNFAATPPTADTATPRLRYDVPNPNLVFEYQAGALRPIALQIDSILPFVNSNYVKVGFGSQTTPFLQAGVSFGDGNVRGNSIYVKHVSSKGNIDQQSFSRSEAGIRGYLKTPLNFEWNYGGGVKLDRTNKYGFDRSITGVQLKDSIRQHFTTVHGRVMFRNLTPTELGLRYSPELIVSYFGDNHSSSEINAAVDIPVEKQLTETFLVKMALNVDYTRYNPRAGVADNNMIWYVAPSVIYNNGNVRLQASAKPAWDNGDFSLLPNILAEAGTYNNKFTLHGGWIGNIRKNNLQYLAGFNPWIWAPEQQINTHSNEFFGGFKGSVTDHFSYNAKIGYTKVHNQPLFINGAPDGKSFQVVNEREMNVIALSGEVSYTIGEKFAANSILRFNQFSNLRDYEKAFGLIPTEWNTALRMQVVKDLWLKSDLFVWEAPQVRYLDGSVGKNKGIFDFNAGLEFKLTRNINLWTQFNNILNKSYQRWNQYQVLGFNFVGGVIINFDQIK